METEMIINIAYNRLMSDLCIKWYLEEDEERKKQIYDEEIMPLYEKNIEVWGNK